ncbi:DUF4190 domain-containing protein [Herbiconiux sp. CPCC 203407]|uniref:DUF4190 domain-containing protein n=1 Tax=Herbiconiux oxytropis TaxID=2970915 RepID=A0AA41XK20_9MICO|nr:DUF4190 domain-containing protein [Herbiconiux oxytropis]MCS5722746.1 DUF4190 domain-containing protein [Herbiconiux oxytropis]MCS5727016.1 DUF4190 domain-containing protein [Herbiconiux oxytropis]
MTDENKPPVPPQYQAAPPVNQYPQGGQQGYGQQGYGQQPATVPGKTLGLVGMIISIVSFFIVPFIGHIAGIIVSAIAKSQSKKGGVEKNTPATVGIVLGVIGVVLSIIGIIIFVVVIAAVVGQCGDLGPGTHVIDGVTYTCS